MGCFSNTYRLAAGGVVVVTGRNLRGRGQGGGQVVMVRWVVGVELVLVLAATVVALAASKLEERLELRGQVCRDVRGGG